LKQKNWNTKDKKTEIVKAQDKGSDKITIIQNNGF
jgi:hypothetical protein